MPAQKRRKKELKITCEILPPGTLKRKGKGPEQGCTDRWEEIVDICAGVIADDANQDNGHSLHKIDGTKDL
ncbi:hypothetical protein D1BOALGB6SA_7108 [Olavius sp. associated proteobacterium Delta 1]|nr:hypothetical protein D1BOALGB6SA_7108 [Olavius sp. associated proteobacterium Delta 1]